jgi:hypothetical protein
MIVGNKWKELEGTRKYIVTGKEVDPQGSKEDLAYGFLASRMSDAFGEEPATVGDIYYQVTRSLGMTSSETAQLVRDARKKGYLSII